jgi:hypothetical protein
MTDYRDYRDYQTILAVIETGIAVARKSWGTAAVPPVIDSGIAPRSKDPGSAPANDFIAWCVLQELRRAGWTIVQGPN